MTIKITKIMIMNEEINTLSAVTNLRIITMVTKTKSRITMTELEPQRKRKQ